MRDYAELVSELRESAEWADRLAALMGRDVGDSKAPLMRKAADAIEELLAESKEILYRVEIAENMIAFYQEGKPLPNVPQWISVEEWLPDVGKLVLVSDGDDIDTACRYKAFTIPDEAETFFWDTVLEVTHWMLLPEPPKEVE